MQSRNLLNLVLLLGIGALVLVMLYDNGEPEQPARPALTNLKPEQLQHIKIQRPGLRDVVLQKTGDHWQILQPFNMPASQFRIDSLVKLVTADVEARHTLTSLKLKDYALDKPKGTIILNNTVRLEFGNTDPIKNYRYIKYNDTLNLVADTFYYLTRSLASEYVDEQLIPKGMQISKLKLPDLDITLNNGKLSVTPQPKDFVSDTAAELLNEWQNARALDIKEFQAAPGAEKLKQDIIVTLDNNHKIIFTIKHDKDNFILIRHDHKLQYIFPSEQSTALLTLPKPIEADPVKLDTSKKQP